MSQSTDKTSTTFTFKEPVNMYSINGIYIGDSSKHNNLCTVADKKWIAEAVPDIKDKPSATIVLKSSDPAEKTVYNVNI